MAYAQWAAIRICPKGCRLGIKNAHLEYGKFYKEGNKDSEVKPSEIEQMNIETGTIGTIYTCGRSDSPSGTEGSFQLFDKDKGIIIGTYHWDCPWGTKGNKSFWAPEKLEDYITETSGTNLDSGALGCVTIKCGHFS